MRFLGLLGIFRGSFKIISSRRKIFAQTISFTVILPFSSSFLLRIFSTPDALLSKIIHNDIIFSSSQIAFLLILTLLSTSANACTAASICTGREVTFKKNILNAAPRVCLQLAVTSLRVFSAIILCSAMFSFMLLAVVVVMVGHSTVGGSVVLLALGAIYSAGLVQMASIWHLASVVPVLEEGYGFRTMARSKDLSKGKLGISIIIFFFLLNIYPPVVCTSIITREPICPWEAWPQYRLRLVTGSRALCCYPGAPRSSTPS